MSVSDCCLKFLDMGTGGSARQIAVRLREGAGPSLSLTVPLFVLGLVLGVAVALFVAFFRETYIDRAVLVLCMLTMSIASLLYIIGGQYLVGMLLRWFPISGFDPNLSVAGRFLALPVLVGLLTGFGAGLSWSAHVLRWGERTTPLGISDVDLPPCPKSALEMIRGYMALKQGSRLSDSA